MDRAIAQYVLEVLQVAEAERTVYYDRLQHRLFYMAQESGVEHRAAYHEAREMVARIREAVQKAAAEESD